MKTEDVGARLILATLAGCDSRLRHFAYYLFIEKKANGSGSSLQFTGSASGDNQFNGVIISAVLKGPDLNAVFFEVSLSWIQEGWVIEADIFFQDGSENTKFLWEYRSEVAKNTEEAASYLLYATEQTIEQGNSMDYWLPCQETYK